MTAAAASTRRAAEHATLELPFRVPAKEWFTIREVAALTGLSDTTVEAIFDKAKEEKRGELFGHEHNGGAGARMTKRIPRVFVVAYLVRTATYDTDALVDCLLGACRGLSREQMHRLHSGLGLYLDQGRHS